MRFYIKTDRFASILERDENDLDIVCPGVETLPRDLQLPRT